MKNSKLLKEMIFSKNTLVMPDAYDALSAKIIEKAGYSAVQCSGYSISLSKLLKNEKLLSKSENVKITEEIVKAISIPVMADGENGYGNNEELKLFAKEINGPLSIAAGLPYNVDNFSIQDCQELGVARVSLPVNIIYNVIKRTFKDLKELKDDYSFKNIRKKKNNINNYLKKSIKLFRSIFMHY